MTSAKQIAPLSEQAHGLAAKHVVLRHEDKAAYEEVRASVIMEYLPRTPQEHRVANQIAQSYWRLLRCRRVETGAMNLHLSTLKDKLKVDPQAPVDNDMGIFLCMQEHPKDFDLLRRYEAPIEKAWYRAIRELRAIQKERRKLEAEKAEEEANNPPLEDTITERPMAAATAQPQERTN